jgi:hypothetical protein
MAERRMFSKQIIDSDVFLDMPQSSQNLYFHLNMRADDEGFINNPKKVMRIIGSNQNDLEILLAKRYLLSFNSGVIVIKHWKLHNKIRKDRLKETLYLDEKAQIKQKKNGNYTELQPNGNQMTTRSRHRLGKVSNISPKGDIYYNKEEESFSPIGEDSITMEDIQTETLKKKYSEYLQCYNKIKIENPESEELELLQDKMDAIESELYKF